MTIIDQNAQLPTSSENIHVEKSIATIECAMDGYNETDVTRIQAFINATSLEDYVISLSKCPESDDMVAKYRIALTKLQQTLRTKDQAYSTETYKYAVLFAKIILDLHDIATTAGNPRLQSTATFIQYQYVTELFNHDKICTNAEQMAEQMAQTAAIALKSVLISQRLDPIVAVVITAVVGIGCLAIGATTGAAITLLGFFARDVLMIAPTIVDAGLITANITACYALNRLVKTLFKPQPAEPAPEDITALNRSDNNSSQPDRQSPLQKLGLFSPRLSVSGTLGQQTSTDNKCDRNIETDTILNTESATLSLQQI